MMSVKILTEDQNNDRNVDLMTWRTYLFMICNCFN